MPNEDEFEEVEVEELFPLYSKQTRRVEEFEEVEVEALELSHSTQIRRCRPTEFQEPDPCLIGRWH